MKWDELDLAIANMDSPGAEVAVGEILKSLRGVHKVNLIQRGAWLSYDASAISKEQICETLHRASYRAGVFQDSKSGHTGVSTV